MIQLKEQNNNIIKEFNNIEDNHNYNNKTINNYIQSIEENIPINIPEDKLIDIKTSLVKLKDSLKLMDKTISKLKKEILIGDNNIINIKEDIEEYINIEKNIFNGDLYYKNFDIIKIKENLHNIYMEEYLKHRKNISDIFNELELIIKIQYLVLILRN